MRHRENAGGICYKTQADVAEKQMEKNNSTPVIII
jgi:hypothetical protein